jgi:hypothetical protein
MTLRAGPHRIDSGASSTSLRAAASELARRALAEKPNALARNANGNCEHAREPHRTGGSRANCWRRSAHSCDRLRRVFVDQAPPQ